MQNPGLGCGKQGAGSMMGDQGCGIWTQDRGRRGGTGTELFPGSQQRDNSPIPFHHHHGARAAHGVFGGPWAAPGSVSPCSQARLMHPCMAQWELSRCLIGLQEEIKHSRG